MRALALAAGAVASSAAVPAYLHPPAVLAPSPCAAWAYSHFVWLDSSRSNQANVTTFLADFVAHNITVGAVDVDSAWSTGFNNFVVDESKFPDFGGFVDGLHSQGVRVILWMTSMVDTDSSNYQEALANGFFIRNGFNESAILNWWHGDGGLLDYSNPDARAWWEKQLDAVLSIPGASSGGIDGWKCDGTDPYIIELLTPQAFQGPITYREYADFYYGHTFNYSRTINPESLIWSRPVDSPSGLLPFNLSLFLAYSPKYVMFSGWVGDQDPNFEGLRAAAINILESAWQNYTNFGSDTGGYRSGDRTREVFLRWSQLNAFLPLFENGGNDEHRPWAFDDPASGDTSASDVYRRLVAAHYELAPFFLTTGTESYAAGVSAIRPTSPPPADFPFIIQPDDVTDWSYALGETIFVSPVLYENVTVQQVTLPAAPAPSAGWYSFWSPASTYPSGAKPLVPVPLSGVPAAQMTHPVFVAQGSILPLHVSTPYGLFPQASSAWAAALTLAVQDLTGKARLAMHDVGSGLEAEAEAVLLRGNAEEGTGAPQSAHISATAYGRPIIIAMRWAGARLPGYSAGTTVRITTRSGSRPLARRPAAAPTLVDASGRMTSEHLALAFDATSPEGGRYPVASLHERVHSAFGADLAGTFTLRSDGGGKDCAFDGVELLVFVGAEDAAGGVDVNVDFGGAVEW